MKQLSYLQHSLLIVLFLVFNSLLFAQTSGGPDEYGYTWKSSDNTTGPVYSWTDISGTGTNLNLTDDSCSDAITIGAGGFYFYGTEYSSIYIGDNGWVNFLEQTSIPVHPFIPVNSEPNALISPFGEDLNPEFGDVYYLDSADKFIIQYENVARFYNNGYNTFQIVMDKTDSTIVFNYNVSDDWNYNGGTGTAITGIENETGTSGLNINNSILENSFSIKFYQPAPYIHFDPESITFTDIWVGNADSTEITLLNSGKSDLLISDIHLENGSDIVITEISSLPMTINQVNSGDFEKFFVKFTPLSAGNYNDNLVIISNSNDANSTLLIPIIANSLQSDISMVTPNIDFGNVQIEYKDTKDMNIIIQNDGDAGLVIGEETELFTGTEYEIIKMPSSLPFTISPFSLDTIVVRFSPPASGVYSDVLEIHSNSPGEEVVLVPITGAGVESEIIFNPSTVAFGATVQGQTETMSFRVTNEGDFKLTVSSMYLITNESFSVNGHSSSFILQPGEYTDVSIDFTPIGVGAVIDSVVFITNLPDDYFVEITGNGILPDLVMNPPNINFGYLLLNETKVDSVILSNTGVGDLIIDNIFLTDGARYNITSSLTYPITLAPTEEYKVEIEFAPLYLGYVFDNLKIQSNISDKTVTIQGKGIFPAIEISQTSYNFGEIQVGESKKDSLYITNNGDADLIISDFDFETGVDYAMLDLSGLPLTVSPSSTEKVYIEFSPMSSQLLSDKITIINNSIENKEISLIGNGTYPGISFDPVIIEFDSTLESSSSNKYFWIKNRGNETLHISEVSVSIPEFELFLASKSSNKRVRDLSFDIEEGDSTQVRVQFTPTSNVLYSGNITIIEETLGTSYISASGQGTRATLELSSNTINFGNQNLNEAISNNITLSSIGNGKLVINSFTDTLTNFQLVNPPELPLNLYPGSSIDIEVQFIPTEFISYNADILIGNNSIDNPETIAVTGMGVGGALELVEDEMDFGDVNVSQIGTESIYIRNIGNQNLTVSDLDLSINSDIFSITSPTIFPLSIDADDSVMIEVTFIPDAVENYNSILTISSNDVLFGANEIELTGNGVSADIFLSPSHLEYGNIHINNTSLDSVNIINTGNADLIITDLNFDSGQYFSLESVPAFPFTISMNSSYKVYIRYSADIMGEVIDELNILNNSVSNVKVNLSGVGSIGSLTSSESQLNFGSVDVGDISRFDFFIKNDGNYEIEITNTFITAGGGFAINDEFFNPIIPAGDSTSIGVTFSPESHTSYFNFLVLESEIDDINIELRGLGLRSYLNTTISNYDFGNVNILTGATSDLITLENTGNKELTISSIDFAVGANFDFNGISLPLNLNAGEQTTFAVVFNPNLPIDYADSLQVINSSVVNPIVNFTGHGLGSNLNLSTSMMNYSEVEIGVNALDTLTITNTGNISLTVDSIYVTNETAFSIHSISGGGLPLNIGVGAEEIVIVQFSPLNVTGYNSSVRLVSDSYDNSVDYCNLLGFGISANIALAPGFLDYSIVKVNDVFTKFFSISNTGNSTLVIESLDFSDGTGYQFYESYSFPMNIEPSENISIGINFVPTTNIEYPDTLTVVNNADNGVFVILDGEGGASDLSVNLSSIDFGGVLVNQNISNQFVIKNSGNYFAHINDLSNSDSHYQLSIISKTSKTCKGGKSGKSSKGGEGGKGRKNIEDGKFSFNIPANDSVTVNVKFLPSAMISYNDIVDIDGEFDDYTVDLSGIGVKAISSLSQTVMDFGSVQISTTVLDTMTITNTGNTNLVVDSFFVVNNNAFDIVNFESFVFPIIIQPETDFDIVVEFSPLYITNYSNRIKILSNNFNNSTQYFYIIGSGEAQDMVLTPTLLDYEMVDLGLSSTKSFRIRNNGSENIFINELNNDLSVFSIINAPNLPYTLGPSDQLYVNVRFLPVSNQEYNDTLNVVTNNLSGTVILTGTGAMASFELSKNEIDFDSVYVNNSKLESFFIVNDGTTDLKINSISLTQPQFKFFTESEKEKKIFTKSNNERNILKQVTNTKSIYTIEENDSLEIFVSFVPTENITYNDILTIESEIGTKTVDLVGKGAIPLLSLNYYSIDYDETEVYSETIDSIVVKNDMELPVNISSMVFSNSTVFSTLDFTLPTQVPANDSIVVKLKFVPNEISHFNSVLHIVNNSGINPIVELSGSGFSNELVLSKLHKDFGYVSVDDEILDTLNISNNSSEVIVFNSLELVTDLHYNILSELNIPFTLPVGEDVDIEYSISPRYFSSNTLVDTILIKSSLVDAKVILSGISQNTDLSISSTLIEFDSVFVDSSAYESITLTNNGLGRIVLEDITLNNGNPFTIDYGSTEYILPEESLELIVGFFPTMVDNFTDSIVVSINGPTQFVSLSGISKQNVGINDEELQITNYELEQNYPNPFNNITRINFAIPKSSIVTLNLFNSKGELVERIINSKNYQIGYHSTTIDMARYSTGIYYYGIEIKEEKFNRVRKMILVK